MSGVREEAGTYDEDDSEQDDSDPNALFAEERAHYSVNDLFIFNYESILFKYIKNSLKSIFNID